MANITRKENKSTVVRMSLKEMRNNKFSNYQALVDNGTITRKTLMAMKEVDMSKCERPISVLQLNYNPVNLIGPFTTAGTNFTTIDVEKNMEEFKDMLVNLETRDCHTKWNSIWKEGYNMFKEFDLVTGEHFIIFVVTNEEIKAFAEQVKQLDMNSLTVEEAKQMQYDFRPIVRAWQESYIDVVKDKTKRFDLDYTDVINSVAVKSTFIKKNSKLIDFNFKAVKAAKRAGKAMPKFEFSLEAVANGQVKNYNDVAADLISKVNDAMIETTVNYLNDDMLSLYEASDDSELLAQFADAAAENKELALFIKQIYKLLNNALFNDDVKVTKEEYALIRNVVYTKASELQIEAEDVITVALSVAMNNVYTNRAGEIKVTLDKDRFSDVHVKNIFPQEFVAALSGITPQAALDMKELVEVNRDIEDGETIEFVNGEAVDGSIVFDNEFSGLATESNGQLLYDIDVYAYEFVEAVVIDTTYVEGTTVKAVKAAKEAKNLESIEDKGEALNALVEESALTHVKIAGQNNNVIFNAVTKTVVGLTTVTSNLTGDRTVNNVITYKAKNAHQQLFLVIFE